MEYNTRGVIVVTLVILFMLSTVLPIGYSKADNKLEEHVDLEAVIGAHSGNMKVDALFMGNIASGVGASGSTNQSSIIIGIPGGKIPAFPGEGSYNISLLLDESHLSIKSIFSMNASNTHEGREGSMGHMPSGSVMPSVGLLQSKPDNLTLQLTAHGSRNPSNNKTIVSFIVKTDFDAKTNDTRSHYHVSVDGTYEEGHSVISRASRLTMHAEIVHTFTTMQVQYQWNSTPGFGGIPSGAPSSNMTAHTYIDIIYYTNTSAGIKNSSYTITIVTDDTIDWPLYSLIAMMFQFNNATVTITPQGSAPITGIQNVTIKINGTGEARLLEKSRVSLDLGELNYTSVTPLNGSLSLYATLKNGLLKGVTNVELTGDFSNGIYIPSNGAWIRHADIFISHNPGKGNSYTIVKGDVDARYEDPVPVFLCLKRAMIRAAEKNNGNLYYSLESGSDNVSFILDGRELRKVVITQDNESLLGDLKVKYGGITAGGIGEKIVIEIEAKGKEAHVTLPHLSNETEVEISSHSHSVIIHITASLENPSKQVNIKVSLPNNHMVIIEAEPGTAIMKDVNITVSEKLPSEVLSGTTNYKPVGPAYIINTKVNGTVTLGLTVNTESLRGVKVLWIHGKNKVLLNPVSVDENKHMVYVKVNGFSAFIPVVETASTTSTTAPQQTTSYTTMTTTTSTTAGAQGQSSTASPAPTGTTTVGEEGKSKNPAMILGVVIIIILVALLAVYISRH